MVVQLNNLDISEIFVDIINGDIDKDILMEKEYVS